MPSRPLLLIDKVHRGGRFGIGQLDLLRRLQMNQRRLHFLKADELVFLQRLHQQRLVGRSQIILGGVLGRRRFAPAGFVEARHALMEPDGCFIVAQADDGVVHILVTQRIDPAVTEAKRPGRDDHELVEFADAHRAGFFDVAQRQGRDGVEARGVRRDLDADFVFRVITQLGADGRVALFQSVQSVGSQNAVTLVVEMNDEMGALEAFQVFYDV